MQHVLLPLSASLDAAGQSSHREATAVSTLVCCRPSHRPLLSARERAFHTMLLPEALSSGETQERERTQMLLYMCLSLCIYLSPPVCPLSIILSINRKKNKMVFKLMYHFPLESSTSLKDTVTLIYAKRGYSGICNVLFFLGVSSP